MDPLALVAAPGGRVHDAQGEEVRVGALALAQAGSQELNQALKKLYILVGFTNHSEMPHEILPSLSERLRS